VLLEPPRHGRRRQAGSDGRWQSIHHRPSIIVLLNRGLLHAEAVPLPTPALPLGFSTAGDAADGLLFGWDLATVQQWVLVYLGLSSLGFVVVWVVGYLRRR
jgi:hypothetical protein